MKIFWNLSIFYHQFYISLPHNTTTKATTPVVEEEEQLKQTMFMTDTDD